MNYPEKGCCRIECFVDIGLDAVSRYGMTKVPFSGHSRERGNPEEDISCKPLDAISRYGMTKVPFSGHSRESRNPEEDVSCKPLDAVSRYGMTRVRFSCHSRPDFRRERESLQWSPPQAV